MDKKFSDEYNAEFALDSDIPEDELTEDQKRLRDLQSLTSALNSERSQAITDKRESIESRLIDAARAYKGTRDKNGNDSLEAQFETPTVYNRVYHNITRQITNDGASQLGDLLFPSDDKNYGLNAAPLAEPPLALASEPAVDANGEPLTDADGQQLTNQQAHNRRVERSRRKTKRMFTKLDASLISAKYPQKGRKCIRDSAIYGTGILKGPITNKVADRWAKTKGGKYALRSSAELEATVKVVSPFDFYPDLSATEPDEWSYTWERSHVLPKQLQKLVTTQGFDKNTVQQLLITGPSPYAMNDEARETARQESFSKHLATGRFELWERRGTLERKYLEAAGVDNLPEKVLWIECVVYMIADRVLKVSVSPYSKDDTIYSIFNWDEDPLSVFGYGVPYLMNDPQHVYNTAWRMTLDNAGVSTLPQIVVDKKTIRPADGSTDYSIRNGKVWEKTGETYSNERQDKPFELFHIQQDIQQLFGLMDRAENDAYELTGVTRVEKNQQMTDNAPVTLGATQIQQNNSSVTRRSQARRYDDQITSTLIQRFYDFFMEFEEDDDIKASMVVEPRGSTILLSKELQATNLMSFYQMTQGGQMEGVKPVPLLRAISQSMQHPEGQFILTDEEMEQLEEQQAQQAQEQDPQFIIEERKVAVEEAKVELAQTELQLKAQNDSAALELKVAVEERRLELEYAKLDKAERESLNKSQAEFAKIEHKASFDMHKQTLAEKTKRDLGAAQINANRQKDRSAELKADSELSIRKQEADRKDAELNHKQTTGESGI